MELRRYVCMYACMYVCMYMIHISLDFYPSGVYIVMNRVFSYFLACNHTHAIVDMSIKIEISNLQSLAKYCFTQRLGTHYHVYMYIYICTRFLLTTKFFTYV